MSSTFFCILFLLTSSQANPYKRGTDKSKEALEWLKKVEPELSHECVISSEADWKNSIDMNEANEEASVKAEIKYSSYQKGLQDKILKDFPDWKTFTDPAVKRLLKYMMLSGPGNLTEEEKEKTTTMETELQSAYSKATVCEYKNPSKCNLPLDPDVEEKLKESEDYDEMAYYFNAWHDAVSKAIPASKYSTFVALLKKGSNANGFKTTTEEWFDRYDDGSPGWTPQKFISDMEKIWKEIRPYYDIIYSYVRLKLRKNAPFKDRIPKCGQIPIHVTGNMWGQSWLKLEKWSKPFPEAPSVDMTPLMKSDGWTVEKMFKVADEFFVGMGLNKLTDEFWKNSVLKKRPGVEMDCHPSASDMCKGKGSTDFRIKMCTEINMENLATIHHEIGHIQYFHYYTDLPFALREAANPGFHEAIGDSLTLAVTTPKHLQCVLGFKLGLGIDCSGKTKETKVTQADINHLFHNALDLLVAIPFAMAVDDWRSKVFDGIIQEKDYNKKWWEIREKYTDLSLPNPRDASKFDPAGKYHIAANVEYARYVFSNILQFSLYEAMCIAAGEFDPSNAKSKPLYQCDFSGNKAAGKLLSDMLKMGFSQPWPIALQAATGHSDLRPDSLIRYFQPLFDVIGQDLQEGGEMDCIQKLSETRKEPYEKWNKVVKKGIAEKVRDFFVKLGSFGSGIPTFSFTIPIPKMPAMPGIPIPKMIVPIPIFG